ncbi:uncharacterized protein SPPG_02202 [Spizellomyces punctatus DAOM BR117]|uniref:PPM-type phosphatase domain-containing protein n=1 Tax=Spizellomyces punctatus (strain DAOM BR117) TaxID=645134 RepID=A0A0L0HQQ2_SPIPD|nr:uncharacterized protein SPPG_02202 [Spizellomyces punctatus DAOM BR117]KND03139.1 hypothetical protein SPPG_02202 [Spizellomyces punctatus DAOM BR117]|eukprot:XP_016611178.1 hypothetical protein SPPG_02202 [Spizellomyces punctatus DAOM BR117]
MADDASLANDNNGIASSAAASASPSTPTTSELGSTASSNRPRIIVASPEPMRMAEAGHKFPKGTDSSSSPFLQIRSTDDKHIVSSSAPSTTMLDELDEPVGATLAETPTGSETQSTSPLNTPDERSMVYSPGESEVEDEKYIQSPDSVHSPLTFDDEVSRSNGFKIGFAEDKNKKYRRTMEDAHAYIYNFTNTNGSGWFAIYDGHAGKTAAEWCGEHLHENFEKLLQERPSTAVPELLNDSFLVTDSQLGERKASYSGCTAVVGFIRTEDRPSPNASSDSGAKTRKRRILYTANVGDARAVLGRDGKAIRLSYDHKGSDPLEAKRIVDSGGFVMNNRVNGVLAVTRSLGDITMKDWIIGSPYTAETILDEKDTCLILACDGIWDVCSDQTAIDLIKDVTDPQQAAEDLLDYALENFSTDNLSVLVVRFDQEYLSRS